MIEIICSIWAFIVRCVKIFESWLRTMVRRHVHWFVVIAIACLIGGVLARYKKHDHIANAVSLGLTSLGFVFAVYTIVEAFERITDMPRVLTLVSELVEETVKKSGTITYICEYPLFGCISLNKSRVYGAHLQWLNRFCDVGGGPLAAEYYLITCDPNLMEERLKRYIDYSPEADKNAALTRALTDNQEMIERLRQNYCANIATLSKAPHFQAVFTRNRAVIFVEIAKFESPTASYPSEKEVPKQARKGSDHSAGKRNRELKLLGWEVSDPKIIDWLESIRDEHIGSHA